MRRFILCILVGAVLCLPLSAQAVEPLRVKVQPITLALPASSLHHTLTGILPLPIALKGGLGGLQGTMTIDSISRLTISDNVISLTGQISGHDLIMNTNIGGQELQVRLGQLTLPVSCAISLRFDLAHKVLFLYPRFQNMAQNNPNDVVAPLLNNLSREYPIPMDNLAPFTWQTGGKEVAVRMEALDVLTEHDTLVLKLRPAPRQRTKPTQLSPKRKKRQP